ncbi:MAG: aromatic ring-hydroxylating dioxygenase subunit alpha [Cyanobacteriota bacterium]|nr:aromatic ring-hydroxylating dioxygenase subunit alpha [Cyanobacteriota bacterium]
MLVSQQPVFQRFWYPVMPMTDLQLQPRSFRLLDHPLVLWVDAQGQPACVLDRCCHRSAKLSLGKVMEGSIQCPYHGWSFNGNGVCVAVPQLTRSQIPSTYQIPAFACQERYGYAWVCLQEPLIGIPEIPEAKDPQFRWIPQFYEVWNCAGLRLMENSFDNAHPQFVHANTFGLQAQPIPPKLESFAETQWGFCMTYTLPVFNSDLQKHNLHTESQQTLRISEATWFLPFVRKLKITYPSGLIHIIVTAATPIDDRSSQIVQFCLRNDQESEVSRESILAFDRLVTLEDRQILESTDYDVPLSISQEQHMVSDKPGIVMRHKLAALLRDYTS